MRKITTICFLLASATVLLSCGGKVETVKVGNPDAAEKILVAVEPSEFKLLLAKDIATTLDNGNRYIIITGLSVLKKTDPAEYGAVIILNAIKAGSPHSKVAGFIAAHPGAGNIVVVNTWGEEAETIAMDADTVSSASNVSEVAFVREAVFLALGWDFPRE